MSSYFDPETPPPAPTQSANFKQILLMLAFGSLGSFFVIKAIQSQPGNSLGVGAVLIVFALLFFAGLIVRNQVVELIVSGLLLMGAAGLVVLTIQTREFIWGVGAVFFVLCVVVIQLKHFFVDQSDSPDEGMKNPYS